MRARLSFILGLLVAAPARGMEPYEWEPVPCNEGGPLGPPEFMPADGTTGVPVNLQHAFVRWPAGQCDFDARLFLDDEEVAVSSIGYMDENIVEYNHQAWRSIGLREHARPGQRIRLEIHPRAPEGFTEPPFVSYFEMGEQGIAPPDAAAAELTGNGFVNGRKGGCVFSGWDLARGRRHTLRLREPLETGRV